MKIPTADEVRKTMRRVGSYVLPSSGRWYGMYCNSKVLVAIHEDDNEVISILDRETGKIVYMDENTKRGWKLFGEMLKGGGL